MQLFKRFYWNSTFPIQFKYLNYLIEFLTRWEIQSGCKDVIIHICMSISKAIKNFLLSSFCKGQGRELLQNSCQSYPTAQAFFALMIWFGVFAQDQQQWSNLSLNLVVVGQDSFSSVQAAKYKRPDWLHKPLFLYCYSWSDLAVMKFLSDCWAHVIKQIPIQLPGLMQAGNSFLA